MRETKTWQIIRLAPEHADALQILAGDAEVSATTRLPHPYPENGARDFIAQQLKAWDAGTGYAFAIQDRDQVVGACGVHGLQDGRARELGYWIGRPYWGHGYATFGVERLLHFAFVQLQLSQVQACSLESNTASRRVLEKQGFQLARLDVHQDPLLKRPDERLAHYALTRGQWQERNQRATGLAGGLAPAAASARPGALPEDQLR